MFLNVNIFAGTSRILLQSPAVIEEIEEKSKDSFMERIDDSEYIKSIVLEDHDYEPHSAKRFRYSGDSNPVEKSFNSKYDSPSIEMAWPPLNGDNIGERLEVNADDVNFNVTGTRTVMVKVPKGK